MSLFCKVEMSPSEDEKMETLLSMNTKELSKLEVMQRVSKKQMSQKEAGEILHLCTRQIKRLLKRYKKQGAVGLISKHRGRKGNNRLSESMKKQGLSLLKTKYQGFGPTLAHEKLVEKDKLKLSVESVRKIMIEEGLWKPRKLKKVVVNDGLVLGSWYKLMDHRTTGSRDAQKPVCFWFSLTMQRGNWCSCNL
jgi:transposase